jgi:hypothetical protein
MKIEVLYVPDCLHHPAAILKLKEALAAEGTTADISEVAVNDVATAKALRFCRSPTILINGRDVAAELGNARDFAVSCRLYPGSKELGVPPLEMISRAVRDAQRADAP